MCQQIDLSIHKIYSELSFRPGHFEHLRVGSELDKHCVILGSLHKDHSTAIN